MSKMRKNEKKILIWDWVFFGILLFIYTIATGYLFYHQAIGNEQWYHSDIGVYMLEMQGLNNGVYFSYPVFFKLGAFFDLFMSPEWAITTVLILLNTLSVVLLKICINRQIEDEWKNNRWNCPEMLLRGVADVLVITLFLVSMLSPVLLDSLPGIHGRYRGVFTPNPYHNATYLAVRPLAIICFFQFARLLKNYEKNFSWKSGAAFSAMLLLATMTKPTFTLLLVATAGLIMLYRLIKGKFENLKATVCLGLCFIPTFCNLLYQFFGMFGEKEQEASGLAFGWLTAWKMYCDNIPLAILLGWAFPLVVLLIHHKELKDNTFYRFSWQIAIVGLLMMMVMYESGARSKDMNFSWGYMHGMFFAFAESAVVMLKSTLKRSKAWYLLVAEWLFYGWHLGCGLLYFRHMLLGLMYY